VQLNQFPQVRRIGAPAHLLSYGQHLFRPNPSLSPRDLFNTRDFEALTLLDGLNKLACLEQTAVGARVEPGNTATQPDDSEPPLFQIDTVQIGYFEFTSGAWLQLPGKC